MPKPACRDPSRNTKVIRSRIKGSGLSRWKRWNKPTAIPWRNEAEFGLRLGDQVEELRTHRQRRLLGGERKRPPLGARAVELVARNTPAHGRVGILRVVP